MGIAAWCDAGIKSLEFSEDETAGHLTEAVVGSEAGLSWLKLRFAGDEAITGCNHTVRTTNFDYPGSYAGDFQIINTAVQSLLGYAIGPNGEKFDAANNNTLSLADSLSSLSDIGNLITSILYKRDMADMELLEAKIEKHKRDF